MKGKWVQCIHLLVFLDLYSSEFKREMKTKYVHKSSPSFFKANSDKFWIFSKNFQTGFSIGKRFPMNKNKIAAPNLGHLPYGENHKKSSAQAEIE